MIINYLQYQIMIKSFIINILIYLYLLLLLLINNALTSIQCNNNVPLLLIFHLLLSLNSDIVPIVLTFRLFFNNNSSTIINILIIYHYDNLMITEHVHY